MKKLLLGIALVVSTFVVTAPVSADNRIDMGISPIRDEFTADPGTTVKRSVKFFNNGSTPTLIYVTTEDCVQGENYGTPKCRAYSGTGGIDLDNSSTWIRIDGSDRFTVPAKSEKIVNYTVTVPNNATPGGHYGAIFFNNPGQGTDGNTVNMVRRIGMLYLMKVPGNIVVDTELGDILIDIPMNSAPDIWDRLRKNFSDSSAWGDMIGELNPFWERPTLSKTNLQISLSIPVENAGNIHIKPTGKIYLYDGDTMLKKIGKESIVDENGVFKGERVVDYLPINDEGGNVLPNSERIFRIDWLGFASQELGDEGNSVISFESPSDYFARQSEDNIQVLYPWDKLSIRSSTKELTAKVEFSYKNPKTGADEVSTLELPITISYNYIAKTPNWGMIIIVALIILLAWIIIRRRNSEIEELEDELDDEIAALEKAQKTLLANKKTSSKKVTQKEVVAKKTLPAAKKSESKKITTKPAVTKEKTSTASSVKKAPAKKAATSPKKAPTSPVAKKTPTKKPTVAKKPAAKKPVAKKAPAKKPE